MSIKRHLSAAVALAFVVGTLTGSALAAPPSSPPGLEQKAEQQAEQAAENSHGSGQSESKRAEQAGTAESGIHSTGQGVKPSSSTEKHTSCRTGGGQGSAATCTGAEVSATSSADHSKRYGNGTTAAQIANSRGAPAGTEVRGPGNSQPHKVCGKNGNWVDVHAVKSWDGVCEEQEQVQHRPPVTPTPTVKPEVKTESPITPSVSPPAVTETAAAPQAGGVAGVSGGAAPVAQPGAAGEAEQAGGVAGALGALGQAGTLPFTGLPLWAVVLVALATIALGSVFRRWTRPAADAA